MIKIIPQVSVIMPIYNVENYLEECLNSLVNQTFRDIEIICVNDGSTDRSSEILNTYAKKDNRIIIITQTNQGAAIARNNGFKHAKGKYVQYVDGDDYFELDMIEKMYKTAEQNEADTVICSAKKLNLDGKIEHSGTYWPVNKLLIPQNKVFNWKDDPKNIFSMFIVYPWNKLYLRRLIEDNHIAYQNLTASNDASFSKIARLCAKRMFYIDEELVTYRESRKDSLSEIRYEDAINSVKAELCLKDFLMERGIYNDLKIPYIKTLKNHIIAETKYCNDRQYEKFLREFKALMPKDWYLYSSALRRKEINIKKLKQDIAGKSVMFWGASLFLEEMLQNNDFTKDNVIGIIDKNPSRHGQSIFGYTIYPPEMLNKLKPDTVIMTIKNNNREIYSDLKEYFTQNHIETELADNIFSPIKKCSSEEELKQELKIWYFEQTGDVLDFDNPQTFNEKIQWLKVYDSTPIKTRLADKYLVRDWIKEQIGEEYLIPLIGVWNSFEEIDFDKLPNQFVLKCNHGSGYNIIVTDKSKFDIEEARKKINRWMNEDFAYKFGYEMHYSAIPRKIIAEKYLEGVENSIYDYRFFCSYGQCIQIWLDIGSGTSEHKRKIYDVNWNELNIKVHWPRLEQNIPKPKQYDKMLAIAQKLSKEFALVRVDFYIANGHIYFGEMTFTSMSGTGKFEPHDEGLKLGNMIKLPKKEFCFAKS